MSKQNPKFDYYPTMLVHVQGHIDGGQIALRIAAGDSMSYWNIQSFKILMNNLQTLLDALEASEKGGG